MNVRTSWMTNNSIYGSDYPNDALTIQQAKERYELQRDYSSEGYSGTIDNTQESFVIQEHQNPINRIKNTKKLFCNINSVVKIGSILDVTTPIDVGDFLVISTIENNQGYLKTYISQLNNSLKFYDKYGEFHNIPCVIYSESYFDLQKDQMVMISKDELVVLCQRNEETELIKWADIDLESKATRFIIDKIPYRTIGLDPHKYSVDGEGCLIVSLKIDQIDTVHDDLVNNIADAFIPLSIEIQNGNTLSIGETQVVQLNTTVNYDGIEIDSPVITYTSSDESIATVDENGLVTTITSGSVTITASYSTVETTIDITVSAISVDNYAVDINSSNGVTDFIKIGQTLVYAANSLLNGEEYTNIGSWSILESDGITPLDSNIISILSTVDNVITIKASSDSSYVGTVFKLKYIDSNAENTLDITMKSIF